jgi:hypothetical protein
MDPKIQIIPLKVPAYLIKTEAGFILIDNGDASDCAAIGSASIFVPNPVADGSSADCHRARRRGILRQSLTVFIPCMSWLGKFGPPFVYTRRCKP